MTVIAVVGLQYGDEGKGKIVDALAEGVDICVRVNGGDNAGHSVVLPDGCRSAVHLLPAGAMRPGMIAALGSGMVISPESLLSEIERVREENPELAVWVDGRAHVVLPYHRDLDGAMEDTRTKPVGTTRRGNGPAYSHKALRIGITIGDLTCDSAELHEKVTAIHRYTEDALGRDVTPNPDTLTDELRRQGIALMRDITDVGARLRAEHARGQSILFSCAHGAMLDIDHGTYPFVTSSTCTAAAIGTVGFDVRKVDRVVGVVKAYTTRIGTGPFPTEVVGKRAVTIREAGREFGTTTGRPRRIGWQDLPALAYAAAVNGVDELALTLVDVLCCLRDWLVCTGYSGVTSPHAPMHPASAYARAEPILQPLPPMSEDVDAIQAIRNRQLLPETLRVLVDYVQDATGVGVTMISNGPRRHQLIV